MRTILLVLLFAFPCFSYCQKDSSKVLFDSLHEFDSLSKYSYLLVACHFKPLSNSIFEQPNVNNLYIKGFGTGFFIRKNGHLLLTSAMHVLTTLDVYKYLPPRDDIDYIALRYFDTVGSMQFLYLNISKTKITAPLTFF